MKVVGVMLFSNKYLTESFKHKETKDQSVLAGSNGCIEKVINQMSNQESRRQDKTKSPYGRRV